MEHTEAAIREWLMQYAWLGTEDERTREVDCIMSQDGWKHIPERIEAFKGQASGEETDLDTQATELALSELYECHDGPHIDGCREADRYMSGYTMERTD